MNLNNGNAKVDTTSLSEQEIKKYLKLFRKRMWLIISTSIICSLMWAAFVYFFTSDPTYESSALLSFQDPQRLSAVSSERGSATMATASLLHSNTLLTEVVKELRLNFSMVSENVDEDDIFSFLDVNLNSLPGYYQIKKVGEQFDLYYSIDGDLDKKNKIKSFTIKDTVDFNQFRFLPNNDYLKNYTDKLIEFKIKRGENTIQGLKNKIIFGFERRGRSLLTITASAKSPQKAAEIVNTVVDKFMEISLKMKRQKNDAVLKVLEIELNIAKHDLDKAIGNLKQFRETNPWVTITPTNIAYINQISEFENKKANLIGRISDLKALVEKLDRNAEMQQKLVIAREILTYLSSVNNIPLLPAFTTQLGELNLRRTTLLNSYAASHPYVVQNEAELLELIKKIKTTALNQVNDFEQEREKVTVAINSENLKVRRLPLKEIELAELVKERDSKSDLYSQILSRFNRAKIENKVDVSDIYIVDHAVPPPLKSRNAIMVRKMFLGIFVSFAIALALSIVREFFNKRVQNVEELQEMLPIRVIGSVPYIKNHNKNHEEDQDQKGKKDSKLITIDYTPTYESESYRDLRTKILHMNQENVLSSFLITSLNPNEGKSLTSSNLAVTIAQQKISTLLIDGDLRRGVLHNVFGNKKKPGLTDFLLSGATIDYNNVKRLVQTTMIPNLFLISSGKPIPNPAEMLGSERMKKLLKLLKTKFGMVMIDTAPLETSTDAVVLSTSVDGAVVVVRANSTNVDQLYYKINQYPPLHNKILGLILNMVTTRTRMSQYQYSYYDY
jgi:tyrosine-protein kinase Etk/Wzc